MGFRWPSPRGSARAIRPSASRSRTTPSAAPGTATPWEARRAGSPLAYGFVVSATNAAAMVVFQGLAARRWRSAATHAAVALPIAVASTVSYLLILWVWSRAPIAPASALRDTSSIFAIVIAIVWLREPFTRLRLCAILLSAAAVPLLRLA